MERREFIRNSCLACIGSMAIVSILDSCTANKYISNAPPVQGKITIKKSDFLTEKKGEQVIQKFILIKQENDPFPIALYRISDTEYKAIFLQCTHQGCELSAYETTMVCPCHGAEFNASGEVTQGPAERNLKTFLTTNDNENIYIQL